MRLFSGLGVLQLSDPLPVYSSLVSLWQELHERIANAFDQKIRLEQPRRVSFVGRFKTGKSRLINALVADEILPYNTDECTAQLVELVFGEQETARRLIGRDLDTAAEETITLEAFKEAIDLSLMSNQEKKLVQESTFRRYSRRAILKTIKILDTPGFDGPNPETRVRAERARREAIKQSDLCVLVLDKGVGEDELKCARLIQQHGVEMIVVLNKSDSFDMENRLETMDKVLSELAHHIGVRPTFYSCSALWQRGSSQEREGIAAWRDDYASDDEDEADWHQWVPMVRHLSQPQQRTSRHITLLRTIASAFQLAAQVLDQYDQEKQAEMLFPNQVSRWREMMPPPLGPLILDIALSAAGGGKPLPWQRLQNFNISPKVVAPQDILPYNDLSALLSLYEETLTEVLTLAHDARSGNLYLLLSSEVETFIRIVSYKVKLPTTRIGELRRGVQELEWFSQPLRAGFSYHHALAGLQARWASTPSVVEEDCSRIRSKLAAALG